MHIDRDGYVIKAYNGKNWREHRWVWTQANGDIPKGMVIHHINGNRSDNRLSNLRMVTNQQNTNRHMGQSYGRTKYGKYVGKRKIDGVAHYFGVFGTKCGAIMASRMAYVTNS